MAGAGSPVRPVTLHHREGPRSGAGRLGKATMLALTSTKGEAIRRESFFNTRKPIKTWRKAAPGGSSPQATKPPTRW